jgi:hypothetical protein
MPDYSRHDYSRRDGRRRGSRSGGGDAVYALGLIGAIVYFWREAQDFWDYVLAVLKGLVWPAFLVHDAFKALAG